MDKLPAQTYKRRYRGIQTLTKSVDDVSIPKEIKPPGARATSLPNCKRVRFEDQHESDNTFDVLMDELVSKTKLPGLLHQVVTDSSSQPEKETGYARKFTLARLQKIAK